MRSISRSASGGAGPVESLGRNAACFPRCLAVIPEILSSALPPHFFYSVGVAENFISQESTGMADGFPQSVQEEGAGIPPHAGPSAGGRCADGRRPPSLD